MKLVQLIIVTLLPLHVVFGQATISGTVNDRHGEAILGVNVYLEGTYDGSSTNSLGFFSFANNERGTQNIVASCIGYKIFQSEIDLIGDISEIVIVLEEEINKIDGITISAGAFEASDKKKSVVLKTFDIVTTAGATADITGVMNTLPGTQTVGEEGRLFVRGGAGHEAKTFINGLLVAEPYGTTANKIPSRFRFSPFLFKGAFFSTGGYSAEYGQALSSVLQLKTYDLPARSQTDVSLMSVGADVSQTIRKNNTSLYGQLQYTNLTPYFALVPQEYEWDKAPNSFNSTIHFKQQFNESGNVQAYANYDQSRMIINQPLPGNIHEQGIFDIATKNLYTNVAIQNSLGKSASYNGGISYSKNMNLVIFDKFQLKTQVHALHTKLVFDHDVSEKVLLKYGGEWIYDQYDELNFDQDNNQIRRFGYDNHLISPFAETSIYFSNNLVARLGARYDYADFIHSGKVSPRASLAYKLNKLSQISMAYGKFSQLPIREYLKFSSNLKPEGATHYILNYQYTHDRRIFRSEIYYKKYDQLVTKQITSPQNFKLANSGYGDAKGVELFWRDGKSFENVDYWISYSYLDTERLYDVFPDPVMPYYASNHNFSIVYKQFFTSIKSQVGCTYSYASGRPYTDPNTQEFNSKMTKSYNDLSVNYTYLIKSNMIIHASLTNVFGFDNIFGYQYNSEPNEVGIYESIPIQPQAKRFLFVGFFITISKDKNANQLNNL
jgi:outer membrane cobalamin receptor